MIEVDTHYCFNRKDSFLTIESIQFSHANFSIVLEPLCTSSDRPRVRKFWSSVKKMCSPLEHLQLLRDFKMWYNLWDWEFPGSWSETIDFYSTGEVVSWTKLMMVSLYDEVFRSSCGWQESDYKTICFLKMRSNELNYWRSISVKTYFIFVKMLLTSYPIWHILFVLNDRAKWISIESESQLYLSIPFSQSSMMALLFLSCLITASIFDKISWF